ncbi:uncharacterized protein LOC135818001 isoform X1 [Sycon ciliatum]|uniref:uncharacterized protein LOC135818001 isoform X1 n=2 Tax=Sycon ciliatum TaxID=27933 RepID=UPI0031F63AB7
MQAVGAIRTRGVHVVELNIAQAHGDSETMSDDKKKRLCAICKNHGVCVPVKGHAKSDCAFVHCECRLCQLTKQNRRIVARQIRERRKFEKERGMSSTPNSPAVLSSSGNDSLPSSPQLSLNSSRLFSDLTASDDSGQEGSGEGSSSGLDAHSYTQSPASAGTADTSEQNKRLLLAAAEWRDHHRMQLPALSEEAEPLSDDQLRDQIKDLVLSGEDPGLRPRSRSSSPQPPPPHPQTVAAQAHLQPMDVQPHSQQITANTIPLSSPSARQDRHIRPSRERINHIRMQYDRLARGVSDVSALQRQAFVLNDPAHVGGKFVCPHCRGAFQCRRDLEFHFWAHTSPQSPYLCHVCGESFETTHTCDSHSSVHGLHDYICQLCAKVTSRVTGIQEHWEDVHLALPTATSSLVALHSPTACHVFAHGQPTGSACRGCSGSSEGSSTPSPPVTMPMLACSEVERILYGLQQQASSLPSPAPREPPASSFMFVDVTLSEAGTVVEYRPKPNIEQDPEYQKHFMQGNHN